MKNLKRLVLLTLLFLLSNCSTLQQYGNYIGDSLLETNRVENGVQINKKRSFLNPLLFGN